MESSPNSSTSVQVTDNGNILSTTLDAEKSAIAGLNAHIVDNGHIVNEEFD